MKVLHESRREHTGTNGSNGFLDMATIQRRVAKIKNGWTADMVRARAEEGRRRRQELDSLVLHLMGDEGFADDEQNSGLGGLTLVG
ncbi:hypothetical protein [Aureliella helgolandensis]|uniref:Uncharacterized protein n=1 Tax=Aureliella helgolandensis TaxID=2527968 RepID=A0A518G2W5_9BACT|nr:hypothetical protein [Aureliella helgolandensis]QDV22941.1 hypothetical protein Q31a_12340 [Aureliella helgolandensis]|tara:strand:- start:527 stop:784 length:258 start_codon:yes stop_codon:yes gene_type:complete